MQVCAGILSVGSTANLGEGNVDLDGGTLQATGNVDLSNVTFDTSGLSPGTAGGPILLVENPDNSTLTGTINGLGEGSAVTVNGVSYNITYNYTYVVGDGVDVALVPSTTVNLDTSADPSNYGDTTTLTATVAGLNAGGGVPTGAVSFYDGTALLGTATLDGTGTATLAVANFSAGVHDLTAVYGGDANFAASSSPWYEQDVAPTVAITGLPTSDVPVGTTVTLGSTVSGTTAGQDLTYDWTVTDANGDMIDEGTDPSYVFNPGDNGSYTVTLVATADGVAGNPVSATINVDDVAPTASLTGPTTGSAGSRGRFDRFGPRPGRSGYAHGLYLRLDRGQERQPLRQWRRARRQFLPRRGGDLPGERHGDGPGGRVGHRQPNRGGGRRVPHGHIRQ